LKDMTEMSRRSQVVYNNTVLGPYTVVMGAPHSYEVKWVIGNRAKKTSPDMTGPLGPDTAHN